MKKIMSLMLGLTLALGCVSLFGQDTAAPAATATTGKTKKAKKAKKAKKDTAAPADSSAPAK